jgi:hypothetical protein
MATAEFGNPWAVVLMPVSPDGKCISFGREASSIPKALHKTGPLSSSIGGTNGVLAVAMLEQQLSHHVSLCHRRFSSACFPVSIWERSATIDTRVKGCYNSN